jgi:hypothetical protein
MDVPVAARLRGVAVRAERGARAAVPLPLLLGGLLVTLFVGLRVGFDPQRTYTWNDSYRYIMTIERILGDSAAQARAAAIRWYCGDLGRTGGGGAASVSGCVAHWTSAGGLSPNTAEYNQIFIARPGYPLLAAPFVAAFGLGAGLAAVSWLMTIAGGWLSLLIARAAGLGQVGSLGAMIGFYLVPSFFWMQQYLSEGPTLVCTLVVLLGTVWALRGRMRLGLTTAAVGYTAGFVVRYSTFSVQAGALAACVLLLALCCRAYRTGRTYRLAGFHAAGLVLMTVLPPVLGWPGFSNSLQDTFTQHFTEPVPADLDRKWLHLMHTYVMRIGTMYLHQPLVPILVLLGLAVLWLRWRALAAVVTAAALTGLGTALAHPLTSQGNRLYFQVFLLAAFGIAVAVDYVDRRTRRFTQPPPEPSEKTLAEIAG